MIGQITNNRTVIFKVKIIKGRNYLLENFKKWSNKCRIIFGMSDFNQI